ncbi:uncharacterized protein LOC125554375 [Triticum urartu]|uniref:uncharacterized protein LOC125554375 n=1 Tax=Triticum urartu TaxID=4572 RepID=UPI0020439544|nr:uncharacterized protein LOC125554375 [Triticum urartu]
MASSPRCCCRWSTKQYVVAVLIVTQAATAIGVIFSVLLSPAHIAFAIANAKTGGGPDNKDYYYFTLVSINTSPRTTVKYKAINFEIWYSSTGWSAAQVDTLPGQWQPPQNMTNIDVKAEYWRYDVVGKNSCRGWSSPNVSLVAVIAEARFKFGQLISRPYTIRVTCPSVNFDDPNISNSLFNCTG